MPSPSPSRCSPPAGKFDSSGEDESPVTSWLLEYADQLGTSSPLTIWFAQALQRHQEVSQIYIDGKFSEFQASLEQALATGSADTQTHDNGRSDNVLAAVDPVANATMHEDMLADGWAAYSRYSRLPSRQERPPLSEPNSRSDATAAVTETASCRMEDVLAEKPMGRAQTKGPCEALALDGAIDALSGAMVPLPSALISAREVLLHVLLGGDSEDDTCQTRTLHLVNAAGVVMVTLNVIFIFMELEKQGAEIAGKLDIVPDAAGWDSMEGVFHAADHAFNAFYLAEMVVKLAIMRRAYFHDPLNVLDAIVAVLNTVDLILLNGDSSSIVLARLARFIKVSKFIRLSRIARTSHELCHLINTLYLSLRALAASAVLLVLVVLVSGLGMAHFVSQFLLDDCSPNVPLCEWAYRHYGSGWRASWTMFQVTLSGGWPAWAADLVESVNWFYILFWVVYIIVVWFGVLRVITALFLKQTMEVVAADQEMMDKEKLRQKAKLAASMRRFFAAADVDCDGLINQAEFKEATLDKNAGEWLHRMGIERTELDALFQMLDYGDGYISFDELLASAARLGGTARASDQMTIICNQRTILDRIEHLGRELQQRRPQHV